MTSDRLSTWDDESAPEISVDGVGLPADPLSSSAPPLPGERFGKYVIVGELARGGMAELFLGVQRGLEGFVKVVVIKRVLPQYSENPAFVRMFVDEARLAARLEHPGIVRTHEFGEVDGLYYTVMEYLPGEDLARVLQRLTEAGRRLSVEQAATLVSRVCAALHFAHELTDVDGAPLHLVHRDVNPSNVILTYGGEVKLIDFGVATTAQHAKTTAGVIKGKLAYMSPEHVLARAVDRRSDVFAAGIVLWELLAGRPLFMRDNEAATLYATMNDPVPSVRGLRPDVPPALEAIVERALAREPDDRFATAEVMRDALEAFLAERSLCDARHFARLLEELFGPARAEAKRAIAQASALAKNVSLVMRLRSDARADLAHVVDALARDAAVPPAPLAPAAAAAPDERGGAGRLALIALALVAVAAVVVGLAVLGGGGGGQRPAPAAASGPRASVTLESSPPGAAISIGGEPTGLTTPATITGITSPVVEVSLELRGYEPRGGVIEVPATGAITEHFAFAASQPSRLVVAGLPSGATIIIDGESHEAGAVVAMSPGTHAVRVVVAGKVVTEISVEATPGDQVWRFDGQRLERAPNP